MRRFFQQFLLYSQAERRAIFTLVVLIGILILVPRFYHYYVAATHVPITDSATLEQLRLFASRYANDSNHSVANTYDEAYEKPSRQSDSLFIFDPNLIDIAGWCRLGLSQKQASVIERYKAKGGYFREPSDINKIYVMSDELKQRLLPYIKILPRESRNESDIPPVEEKFISFEINAADSAQWEELRWIGPYRASRIVKYGKLLGGYRSVDQVAEVHGLPDSVYVAIKPHLMVDSSLVVRININECDYETLRKHPYFKNKIARAIIAYRDYNGRYETLESLKDVPAINDYVYNRIAPYITLE